MATSGSQSVSFASDPGVNGFKLQAFDPAGGGTSTTSATAATIFLTKLMVRQGFTASAVHFICTTSGTGATAISNAQCGIYNSAGVLLGSSTATDMAASGTAAIDEQGTVPFGGSVTLTATATGLALAADTFVWAAIHVGTQASTVAQFMFSNSVAGALGANLLLTAATSRFGSYTGHASNNLATIGNLTPASITAVARCPWLAVS